VLVTLYLIGLMAVVASIRLLSDAWWPATLILFGPRWIWGLPLAVLVPAAFVLDRRLLFALGLGTALVVGPIMGLCLSCADFRAHEEGDLRVMTYNIGGGQAGLGALEHVLTVVKPDIVALQEVSSKLDLEKLEPMGFHVHVDTGMALLSRFPIRKIEARDRSDVWKMNGSGAIIRYEIETPSRTISLLTLHLETVRDGLEAIMSSGLEGAPELEANIRQRDFESKLARDFMDRHGGASFVVGDFNMPVESAIYQRYWSSFTNAFSAAGLGFGESKYTRWFGIRIDHVLVGRGWASERAFVGPHIGLDHRPMIADLRWVGP